jgi:hypothetical protein
MSLIETKIDAAAGTLTIDAPGMETRTFPLAQPSAKEGGSRRQVSVWGDACIGYDMGDELAKWFNTFLQLEKDFFKGYVCAILTKPRTTPLAAAAAAVSCPMSVPLTPSSPNHTLKPRPPLDPLKTATHSASCDCQKTRPIRDLLTRNSNRGRRALRMASHSYSLRLNQ